MGPCEDGAMMRPNCLILAGPPGVGKSSVSELVAEHLGWIHLDVDELRERSDIQLGSFCLERILEGVSTSCVVDLGGDTMFRSGPLAQDPHEQLKSLSRVRARFGAQVIVMVARSEVLRHRFMSCKEHRASAEWFRLAEGSWSFAAPFWQICADRALDTSDMSCKEVADEVISFLGG